MSELGISNTLVSMNLQCEEGLSSNNLALSQTLQMFCTEAFKPSMLIGASAANLCGSLFGFKAFSLCSKLFGSSAFATKALTFSAKVISEGAMFHIAPEFLATQSLQTTNLFRGSASSTLMVAFSQAAGKLGGGLVVQQMFQNFAVLGSQDLSAYLGWSEMQRGGLCTRILYAQMSSCQMQVGAGVVHMTCHEITMMNAQISLTESLQTARTRTDIPQGWLHSIQAGLQGAFGLRSANEMPIEAAFHQASEQQARREKGKNIFMMTGGEEGGLISAAEIMAGKEDGLMSAKEFGMTEVPAPEVFELDPAVEYHPRPEFPQSIPGKIIDPKQALVALPMGGATPYGTEWSTYLHAVKDPRWVAELATINGRLKRLSGGRYMDSNSGEVLDLPQIVERFEATERRDSGAQPLASYSMRLIRGDHLYENMLTGEQGKHPPEKLLEMASSRDLFLAVPYEHGIYVHPMTQERIFVSTEQIRTARQNKEKLIVDGKEVILFAEAPYEYSSTGDRLTRARAEAILSAEFSSDAEFEKAAQLPLETDWAGQLPPGLRGKEGKTAENLLELMGLTKEAIRKSSFSNSISFITSAGPAAAMAVYAYIRAARRWGFPIGAIGNEIGIHVSGGIGEWEAVIHGTTTSLRRAKGGTKTHPRTDTFTIAKLLNDFFQGLLGVPLAEKGEFDAEPVADNAVDVGACATHGKNRRRAADSVRSGRTKLGIYGATEAVLGLPWARPAITTFNAIMAMATRKDIKGADIKSWYAPLFTGAGFQIAEMAGVGGVISLETYLRTAPAWGALVGGYSIRGDQGGKKNSADMGIGPIRAREESLRMMGEVLGLSPDVIQILNLHGTGTPKLNQLEVAQAVRIFHQAIRVVALKAEELLGGHGLGAAGAAEENIGLLSLEHRIAPGAYIPQGGKLHPSVQKYADERRVSIDSEPFKNPEHIEFASNGFGGSNANANLHLLTDKFLHERAGQTLRQIDDLHRRQSERADTARYWEEAMDVSGTETGATFLSWHGLRERVPSAPAFIDMGAVRPESTLAQPPILAALSIREKGGRINYKNTSPELAEAYEAVESAIHKKEGSLEEKLGQLKKEEERDALARYVRGAFYRRELSVRTEAIQILEKIIPLCSKGVRWEHTRDIANHLVDSDLQLRTSARVALEKLASGLEQTDIAFLAWKAAHVMRNGFPQLQENSHQLVRALIPLVHAHERTGLTMELIRWQVENGNRTAAEAELESSRPHLVDDKGAPRNLADFEEFARKTIERVSEKPAPKSPIEERLDRFLSDPEKALDIIVAEAVRISATSPVLSENQVSELITAALKKDLLVAADEASYAQRLEIARRMQGVFDPAITPSLTPYLRTSSTFQFTAYTFAKLLLPRVLPGERGTIAISLGRWLLDQQYGNHHGINYRMTRDEMIQELQEIGSYLGSAEENSRFQQEIHTMMTVAQEREIRASRELAARSR